MAARFQFQRPASVMPAATAGMGAPNFTRSPPVKRHEMVKMR